MNSLCRWVRGGIPRVGFCCLVGLFMGSCGVVQSRHDAVVAGMESARVDLENSRMMRESLERDNEKLRAENEGVARELEVMGAEIQRIKEDRDRERAQHDAQGVALEKVSQARMQALQALQRAYRKLQNQNRALEETVGRYQKELKEARAPSPVASSSLDNGVSPAESMMEETLAPESSPVTTPLNGATKLLDLNTASVQDFVIVLGLSETVAEKVMANRPYRIRGELLARQVLPHETFDMIKDSITAAPH